MESPFHFGRKGSVNTMPPSDGSQLPTEGVKFNGAEQVGMEAPAAEAPIAPAEAPAEQPAAPASEAPSAEIPAAEAEQPADTDHQIPAQTA